MVNKKNKAKKLQKNLQWRRQIPGFVRYEARRLEAKVAITDQLLRGERSLGARRAAPRRVARCSACLARQHAHAPRLYSKGPVCDGGGGRQNGESQRRAPRRRRRARRERRRGRSSRRAGGSGRRCDDDGDDDGGGDGGDDCDDNSAAIDFDEPTSGNEACGVGGGGFGDKPLF